MKSYLNLWFYPMIFVLGFSFIGCSSDENDMDSPTEVDTKVPSIVILSPSSEESYVTDQKSITISGTAHDETALKEISYITDRGINGLATGLEQWSIEDLKLEEGDNVITVKAIDKGNNETTASITITKNRYLIFFGIPFVNNTLLYSNEATENWITVSIAPNDHLLAESVRVIEIDKEGKEINEVCHLFDDGDLTSHGDEIKGDNIYSNKHTFILSDEGTHRYRVSARTYESEGEVSGFSSVFTITVINRSTADSKIQTLMSTLEAIEIKVKELADQQLSTEEKESILKEYLKTLNSIVEVERIGADLKVTHSSGFISFIELEANDYIKGIETSAKQRGSKSIPLNNQTRGINLDDSRRLIPRFSSTTKEERDNIILNKNILIWAAYENQFPQDMEPSLRTIFDNSPVKFDITYLKNEQCTINSLENLSNYGIIIFDTHGQGGEFVLTRNKVIYSHDWLWGLIQWGEDNHEELRLLTGEYGVQTNRFGNSYYAVTSKFFRTHIKGTLPNSVVFNGSCESLKTEKLSNAFISKGARTYLGFLESVGTDNCCQKADEFFAALVGSELKTTGEAYESSTVDFDEYNEDGTIRHNKYLLRGSSDMHFYLGLINGDFEYGNMSGWTTTGDGRVISSLGPLRPTQEKFMGIVSTGLGYTVNFGKITQSFYVSNESNLSLRWNFLSEEFMEYVGSVYQDYLKVSIIVDNKEHELIRTNVDAFAANYSLSRVSPDIVFDQGDVYMTGWVTSSYDISAYQGKTVTLVIESGDVGDSIYDSATLLDEISIN